jgi:two-component system, OmpR family, sensor kinase
VSLRLRLTLFYTLFLAVVLVVVAAAVYGFTVNSFVNTLQERSKTLLDQFVVRNFDPNPTSDATQSIPRDAYFLVRFITYEPTSLEELSRRIDTGFTLTAQNLTNSDHRNPTSDDLFAYLSPSVLEDLYSSKRAYARIILPERRQIVAYLRQFNFQRAVSVSSGQRVIPPDSYPAVALVGFELPTQTFRDLLRLLLRTILIAFLVFGAGVWLLSYRVLLPVKRVTHAASQVTGLDLSQRVPLPKANDEMRELAETVNNMLDRLQESFETQRRFTADASHELRTPVTAIVGHANYLLRRTKPSEEQIDSLTVIRREAERMAKLVNDLLELARADAGFAIKREPMNLVEVVEAAHKAIAPVATGTNITLSMKEPLIEVSGDAGRLKQVILNLIQNAVNAGSKNVTVSLYLDKNKHDVNLEVLDDGPGIPAEALPHIFDRFYRVDGARSTRGNGSGLGLAIVKWIVQQHEGTVSVESKLGEGTVFTVVLPLLNPKQTEMGNLLAQTFAGVRQTVQAELKPRENKQSVKNSV